MLYVTQHQPISTEICTILIWYICCGAICIDYWMMNSGYCKSSLLTELNMSFKNIETVSFISLWTKCLFNKTIGISLCRLFRKEE